MPAEVELPLSGIYVLDFVPGPMAAIGRHLAELGADVVRVEPPAGLADRAAGDNLPGWLDFTALNAGKRATTIDTAQAAGRERLSGLLASAHVVLLDASPGSAFPLDPEALREQRPQCVLVSVSNFGLGNSCSTWQISDPILHALSGSLSRSGVEGMPPVLPPAGIAEGCAAAQGLWVTLVALYRALTTGVGDHLDFALLDGAMHSFDPGFGVGGVAALGARPADLPPGRPELGYWYPVLPCADGRVRLCVLAPRQWDRLFEWMGEPEAFADPKYRDLYTRLGTPALWDCVAAFFADKSSAELEAGGEARGVPVVRLMSLAEVVEHPQLRGRGATRNISLPDGGQATLPAGAMLIDGERMSARGGAPALADDPGLPLATPPGCAANSAGCADEPTPPLAQLKVLDLGVIVAGAEAGRMFADLGADVIKVESAQSPDATRRPLTGLLMVPSVAAGHRNKRGLGLNMKDPRGREYFLELAARADIILSNFKPGTLEKMGLSFAEVAAVNPRIVMAESSAFGASGPLAGRMGYGPLVRAMSGLTQGWRYSDRDDLFTDQVVVYPDHVAGRYVAAAALALLIRRLRTGRGGSASIAQLEVILGHLGAAVARRSAGLPAAPDNAPWGVYPCAGEDQWLVISVHSDSQWQSLARCIDRADLLEDARFRSAAQRCNNRVALEEAVGSWTRSQEAEAAMGVLQAAGVPAGCMLRTAQLPDWPHFRERQFFRSEQHPLLEEPLVMDNAPVRSRNMPAPGLRPAPERGEHTREVLQAWLQLPAGEVEEMIAAAVFEVA